MPKDALPMAAHHLFREEDLVKILKLAQLLAPTIREVPIEKWVDFGELDRIGFENKGLRRIGEV